MSSAQGKAYVGDELVGWFRYNGTPDVVIPALFASAEELTDNWRAEPDKWEPCTHDLEDAILVTSYGAGFEWDGKVCRQCMAVRGGWSPNDFYWAEKAPRDIAPEREFKYD